MVKDRLTVQRDRKGGWYVVIDGATARFETFPDAVSVACAELGAYEALAAMNADLSANVKELSEQNEKLCAELAKFEKLCADKNVELDRLRSEKKSANLAAFDAERDLFRFARLMARQFG